MNIIKEFAQEKMPTQAVHASTLLHLDNGEIIATEKELYSMESVLVTLDRIFDEAPYKNGDITCGYKELAVYFGE